MKKKKKSNQKKNEKKKSRDKRMGLKIVYHWQHNIFHIVVNYKGWKRILDKIVRAKVEVKTISYKL